MTRTALSAVALAAALGVAACDNTEYETQIGDLQTQLETARGEVGELETQLAEAQSGLGEMEQMRVQLEEARARVEELESQPVPSSAETDTLRTELEEARTRIDELEQENREFASAETGEGVLTTADPAAVQPVESDVASPEASGAGRSAATLQEPLAGALSALREVDQQLVQLRDALVGEGYEDLEIEQPRSLLRAAGENIAEAARAAGVEIESLEAAQ